MSRSGHDFESVLKAGSEPRPGWALLLVPLLLIALEARPDLSWAMIRLAVVLLLGTFAWGLGRGPAGPWAERGFAALLLVAWFAVCGTALRLHGVPASMPGRLAFSAALLLGPGLLLWAWHRRARMEPVAGNGRGAGDPGSGAALLGSIVLVGLGLLAADRLFGLERADLVVIGTGLLLFAAFRVRGRRPAFGLLG